LKFSRIRNWDDRHSDDRQNTGETLQQIPNEAMLNVAATLGKLGIIFNRVV
jgi:uncharacterized FlaG/YvyC family protein